MAKGVPMSEEQKAAMAAGREAKKVRDALPPPPLEKPDLEKRVSGMEQKLEVIANAVLGGNSAVAPTPHVALDPYEVVQSVETEVESFAKRYRTVVDRELGPEFKIEPLPSGSGIKIFMPPAIDRRDGLEKDANNPDISVASPLRAGVEMDDLKIWCKRIKENIIKKYPTYFVK